MSSKYAERMVSVRNQYRAMTNHTSVHVTLVHGGLLVVILANLETLASPSKMKCIILMNFILVNFFFC